MKPIPYREQLELDVLGYLIYGKEREQKFRIMESLEPQDFTGMNGDIYKAIVRVFVRLGSVDLVLVDEALNSQPRVSVRLTEVPMRDYLSDAEHKAIMLQDVSRSDRILGVAKQIVQELEAGQLNGQFKRLEDFIFSEYRMQISRVDIDATVASLLDENQEHTQGWDWIGGVPTLLTRTGGVEPCKLYVMGAVKKSGKTRVAVAIMKRLIEQGVRPLFLSMEMREKEVMKLFLSAFSGVNSHAFNRRLAPYEIQSFREKYEKFQGAFDLDVESYLTLEKIRAKVWRAQSRGCRVVVIDFFQRMGFPDAKGKNYATIVSETAARLADIARDYGVAIILLSQLRNEAEDEQIADMRFLKESGGIAENADTIITLTNQQRKAKGEEKYRDGDAEIWFAVEQRSGMTTLIKTEADLGRMQFKEIDDRYGLSIP